MLVKEDDMDWLYRMEYWGRTVLAAPLRVLYLIDSTLGDLFEVLAL
jgi:hypothetical protein